MDSERLPAAYVLFVLVYEDHEELVYRDPVLCCAAPDPFQVIGLKADRVTVAGGPAAGRIGRQQLRRFFRRQVLESFPGCFPGGIVSEKICGPGPLPVDLRTIWADLDEL